MKMPKGFWKLFGVAFAVMIVVQIGVTAWELFTGDGFGIPGVQTFHDHVRGTISTIIFFFIRPMIELIGMTNLYLGEGWGVLFYVLALFLMNAALFALIISGIVFAIRRRRNLASIPTV